MTYVPDDYTRAENALDEIVKTMSSAATQEESAIAQLNRVQTNLQQLSQAAPVGWLEAVQFITSEASNNPDDPAWQALKARMDRVVADFQARRTAIAAINQAIVDAS